MCRRPRTGRGLTRLDAHEVVAVVRDTAAVRIPARATLKNIYIIDLCARALESALELVSSMTCLTDGFKNCFTMRRRTTYFVDWS